MSSPGVATLPDRVDEAAEWLAAYLPEGVRLDSFIAQARSVMGTNRNLAESRTNVLAELVLNAARGVPLDGRMRHLEVRQWSPTPATKWKRERRGTITLAVATCGVLANGEGVDGFLVERGLEPRLVPRSGVELAAYSVARLRSGGLHIEALTRQDLEELEGSWARVIREFEQRGAA